MRFGSAQPQPQDFAAGAGGREARTSSSVFPSAHIEYAIATA